MTPRLPLIETMRSEHGRVLAAAERLAASSAGPATESSSALDVRELLVTCERELSEHMTREEHVVFPALENALLEARLAIEPLRQEHEDLRFMLAALMSLLREPAGAWREERLGVQVRDLLELLQLHVRKEERLVSGVVEHLLPTGRGFESTQDTVAEGLGGEAPPRPRREDGTR